jgi:hypothetical protein
VSDAEAPHADGEHHDQHPQACKPGGDTGDSAPAFEHAAQLDEMREWREGVLPTLSERGRHFLAQDATLRRYLRARNGSVPAARDNLLASIQWREQHLAPPLHCAECHATPHAHCFFPIGWTREGRPILYGNPPRAACSDVPPTVRHVTHTLEHCWTHPRSAEQWVWLTDFRGFGFTHAMQARLGIEFATVFSQQFPERLGAIVLLNPPTVFSLLLSAIKPFADARTMAKVVVVNGDAPAVVARLQAEFGFEPHTCEWVSAVLAMDPVPGNLPPLPAEGHEMALPPPPGQHAADGGVAGGASARKGAAIGGSDE